MFSASRNWEKLKQIIADKLYVPSSKITPEASLYDLAGPGWNDAIDLVELIMDIEHEFNVSIDDETASTTVGSILALIDKHAP